MMMINLFMGISTGSNVLVAQYYGARNEAALRHTLHTAIVLALMVGLTISSLGFIFAPQIQTLMNVPDEIKPLALGYLRILFAGIAFQMMYNMLAGFMRGLGNSRTPLYTLILSASINGVLTYIFVIPMQLGVNGSAIATIIAQCISSLTLLYLLHTGSPMTRIALKEMKLDKFSAVEILKIGMPTAVQQVAMSFGGLLVQGTVNSYGTVNIAGYGAAMRVDAFAMMPIMSFGMSMTNYTAQNVGAGRMDRVRLGVKHGLSLSVGITAFMASILLLFGRYPLMMFTDNEPTIEAALLMMRTLVPFYVLNAVNQPLGGVLRGSGETVTPMTNALMMNLGIRIPLLFLLTDMIGNITGVYWSQIGGWCYGFISMIIIYRRGKWRRKALLRIDELYGEGVAIDGVIPEGTVPIHARQAANHAETADTDAPSVASSDAAADKAQDEESGTVQ